MKRLLGLLAVAGLLLALPASHMLLAKPPHAEKVLLCHATDDPERTDGGVVISVAMASQAAHLAHGDCILAEDADDEPGDDCTPDPDGDGNCQ